MNLALFDFDGTITDREMYLAFLDHAVYPIRLAVGKTLLAPLAIGYKLGLVSGSRCRAAAARFAFRGAYVSDVEERGISFAQQVLPQVIRPEAMARIDWHRAQGDTVVVVSGALEVALSPWCERQKLPLLASRLEQREGRYTGRYAGAQCVLAEKARRIREAYTLADYETIYAYGDTPEDHHMLALATQRFYRGQAQPSA